MRRVAIVLSVACLLDACGGPGGPPPGAAAAETQELPRRSGAVWEVDPTSPPEAQVLAYLHGLHAFVREGDDVYTATTRLTEVREDGYALVAKLGADLEARMEVREGKPALTFSSGHTAILRPQGDGERR